MARIPFVPAVLLAVALGLLPTTVHAQSDLGLRHVGLRGGLTVDPDQGHIGMHFDTGTFAPKVRFQPSVEVGFGSDRVVGMFNIDAFYTFEPGGWAPYLGGGLGIGVVSRDRGRDDDGGNDVNVEAGVNLVGGFEWGDAYKYLLEARLGIGDIPDFKLTIGVNF